ncbi:hypothetical protein DIZ27_11025 [Streptomyces sp. NWU339]|nr:hypothetical protein DIZ27_11025 [Streptomyces sp. NWU339]
MSRSKGTRHGGPGRSSRRETPPLGRTRVRESAGTVAVAHGVLNVVGGLWPLLRLRTCGWVSS